MKGWFAAMLLAISLPAVAAERNEFNLKHYTVRGSKVEQLRAEVNAKGPIGESGIRGEGNTRWYIAWRFRIDRRAGVCTASAIEVDLQIDMILPKWDRPWDVDPALVAHWDRYMAALRKHENGHRQYAESAAREVRRALTAEAGPGDCDTLRNRLDSKANDLLDALRRRQAAYDRDTGNGKTQGVWLPEYLPQTTGGS